MTFRRLAALAVAAALVLSTAGCSWSFLTDPPGDLVAAANAYAAEVGGLPGVADATAEVRAVDPKDKPDQWTVALKVVAADADGLESVPASISGIRPPSGADTHVVVHVPAGEGVAAVVLSDASDDGIDRAGLLRALPFAVSVSVSVDRAVVGVTAATRLATAVAAIRESGTLSTDPLDSVGIASDGGARSMEVSQAGPSAGVTALIEKLQALDSVKYVNAYELSEFDRRPAIRVSTSDQQRVLAMLTGFVEDQHDGRPRTSFTVSTDTDYFKGFLGLPLGAAEPDDLPTAAPAPVDEAALAAALAADTESVTAFLNAAVEASGLPGTPEVFVTDCSSKPGSRVQGTLFLTTDTADDPYAAIVESWESDGYTHSDQAMGTSAYSPTAARAVVQATIRGTSEGIRVGALSECRA